MIEFVKVCKRTRKTITPIVYEDLSFRIEDGERVALLGGPASGLNVILELICGANAPDQGRVIRTGTFSWPIPDSSFFHKHLSFVGNARFIARMYGMQESTFIPRVMEMAGVEDLREERLDHCPKGVLGQFSFALGLFVPFDTYIFTKVGVGKGEMLERIQGAIADLGQRSGLLIATGQPKGFEAFCDKAYVLDEGQAFYYEDLEAAQEHLKRSLAKAPAELEEFAEAPEEELLDDFF